MGNRAFSPKGSNGDEALSNNGILTIFGLLAIPPLFVSELLFSKCDKMVYFPIRVDE